MDARELLEALRRAGRTLALAESYTGGLVVDRFVAEPGASDVVLGCIVAYDDGAKRTLLGVRDGSLRVSGAVSEAVAVEMADGARRAFRADVGLSTTGIAGPGGATPAKPVGTVVAAAAGASGHRVERALLPGDRDAVRRAGADHAIEVLARWAAGEGIL